MTHSKKRSMVKLGLAVSALVTSCSNDEPSRDGVATAGRGGLAAAVGGAAYAGALPPVGGTRAAGDVGGRSGGNGASVLDAGAGQPTLDGVAGAVSCQLAPQQGCPGQACDLDYSRLGDGTTLCRAITVPGTDTSLCATTTECAAGYLCLGGSCAKFCRSDVDCGTLGSFCLKQVVNSATSLVVPGITACSASCDPVTAAGCPQRWGCGIYLDTATQRSYPDCQARLGSGVQGSSCTLGSDCAPGYGCIAGGNGVTTKSCRAYCVVGGGGAACPGSSTCSAFAPAVIIGETQYGICMS